MSFFKKTQTNDVEPAIRELMEQERIYQQGISSVKDLIAPSAFKIMSDCAIIGKKYATTFFIHTYPRYLQTNWFSPVINFDVTFDVAMFIHPMDSASVLKNLLKVVTQIQSQININEQAGKVRDPILETAMADAEGLRDSLQQGSEKFFRLGIYITLYADTKEEMDKLGQRLSGMLEAQLVYAKPAVFQMEDAFGSTLPLAQDKLAIGSNMNTGPLSTCFPFVSSDLTSNRGILYGINRHNNSLILFDRFSMENANMVIFAKSGAGKSYAVKLEILRSLMFGTDVIVIDPENEYKYLAETVNGTFFRISLTSDHHINPFDLPAPLEDEDPSDVLKTNIIHLSGLLKIMLGTMTPEEDAILDKAISETYATKDIIPGADFSGLNVPTMSDLADVLANMAGAESLSIRLKKYTEGTFGGFLNQPTNIKVNKNLVVFNIRDMEEGLRPVAMYVIMHYIWTMIRSQLKKRILVVDEAWWMMQHEEAASFLFAIAKRCRKYYMGLTTITQDITDFLGSRYGKPIVTNSSIQLLLRQSPAAIDAVRDTFYLTDEEKYLLLESNIGEGIFFAGAKHAAIKIIASYSEDQIITSNPEQIMEIEKARKEMGK
ncbi:ATP-binding protein [Patescibacteria group bacterium]|nr:ATP-binding protein [Patescibacteria group bacterium]MBU3999868.1 ATP-binding protein [Patescibacteria group bacterium]MBU4056400.1 ATP-binding protein [Patescibacteria group bacterium]MBU4368720.1 ATP-binding protein [Patescibacteria group bacterium]